MKPERASTAVSSSSALLENHVRNLGFASCEAFILDQNPDGQLESLSIPQMPTVRLVREGTPARLEVTSLRQIVFSHVSTAKARYAVVQVA